MESNQEGGFEENEFLYDDLEIEEMPIPVNINVATSPPNDSMEDHMILGVPSSATSTLVNSTTSPSPSPSSASSSSGAGGVNNHSRDTGKESDGRKRQKSETLTDDVSTQQIC